MNTRRHEVGACAGDLRVCSNERRGGDGRRGGPGGMSWWTGLRACWQGCGTCLCVLSTLLCKILVSTSQSLVDSVTTHSPICPLAVACCRHVKGVRTRRCAHQHNPRYIHVFYMSSRPCIAISLPSCSSLYHSATPVKRVLRFTKIDCRPDCTCTPTMVTPDTSGSGPRHASD